MIGTDSNILEQIQAKYKFKVAPEPVHFFIDSIVSWLDIEFCEPEKRIIQYQDTIDEDENNNFMYFIYSGHVHATKISTQRLSKKKNTQRKIIEGQYFGEISLLTDSARTFTIETHNNCIIAKLS